MYWQIKLQGTRVFFGTLDQCMEQALVYFRRMNTDAVDAPDA
jgi:hypothetical protein